MYYSELKSIVKTRSGNIARDTQIQDWTNNIILDLNSKLFEAQLKEYRFSTVAIEQGTNNAGTVSGTAGTKTLTFTDTTLTQAMADNNRKVYIENHDNIYKITAVSGNDVTTDVDIIDDISGASFEIYQDEYIMPYDYIAPKIAYRYDIELIRNNALWEVLYRKGVYRSDEPTEYTDTETVETAYYDSDTDSATITVSGTTATVAGTTFDSEVVGRILRIKGSREMARITAVNGAGDTLTLDRTGLTANSSEFEIDPPKRRKLILYPAPDEVYTVNMLYYHRFLPVFDNSHVLPFPDIFHPIIVDGVHFEFAQHQREALLINISGIKYNNGIEKLRTFNNEQRIKGKIQGRTHVPEETAESVTYPRTFIATGER